MQKGIFITEYNAKKLVYFKTHKSLDSLHYQKACIGYLVKGNAEYLYDGKKYAVKEGDLIYIPKNSTCVSMWKGSPDIIFYSLNFDYRYGKDIESFGIRIFSGFKEELFINMLETLESNYMKSIGFFYMLLDELFARLEKDYFETIKTVAPAIKYIKENLTEKLYISSLANLCNMSVSNLYLHFNEEVGCTPIEYKNNLLVQKGADLLLNSGLSVEEAARQLNFSSTAYFRKLFKKYIGKLPKEFKK